MKTYLLCAHEKSAQLLCEKFVKLITKIWHMGTGR